MVNCLPVVYITHGEDHCGLGVFTASEPTFMISNRAAAHSRFSLCMCWVYLRVYPATSVLDDRGLTPILGRRETHAMVQERVELHCF